MGIPITANEQTRSGSDLAAVLSRAELDFRTVAHTVAGSVLASPDDRAAARRLLAALDRGTPEPVGRASRRGLSTCEPCGAQLDEVMEKVMARADRLEEEARFLDVGVRWGRLTGGSVELRCVLKGE